MGLLKSGMKYGGLAYAARSIGKGVAAHEENKAATASTKPTTIAAHDQYNRQQPQQGPPQGPPPYEASNDWGYVHASWCDGSCGGQCRRVRMG